MSWLVGIWHITFQQKRKESKKALSFLVCLNRRRRTGIHYKQQRSKGMVWMKLIEFECLLFPINFHSNLTLSFFNDNKICVKNCWAIAAVSLTQNLLFKRSKPIEWNGAAFVIERIMNESAWRIELPIPLGKRKPPFTLCPTKKIQFFKMILFFCF